MKSSIRSTAELARRLGVSRWTVSRALNGHAGVNADTVARITKTARQLGFAPSMLGRGLRSGRTDQVGICLPDLVDYFLTAKIMRLQQTLQQQALHPLLQIIDNTVETENVALERFAAMRCASVIGIASRLDEKSPGVRSLASAGIPFIRIDPLNVAGGFSVSTDRRTATREALIHLHQLGHRRLIAIGFSPDTSYGRQRLDGLRAGCRTAGWNFRSDISLWELPEAPDDFSAGAALAEIYLKNRRSVHAILALNDRVAMGLMRNLQAHGVVIPDEVSLIGYDNTEFCPHAAPALTSIDPQVDLLIEQAVKMLAKPDLHSLKKPFFLKPLLVIRDSTASPPKARRGKK